jgi:hypothetical protein
LKAVGLKTTVRYSLGGDIQAACGQLARRNSSPVDDFRTRGSGEENYPSAISRA